MGRIPRTAIPEGSDVTLMYMICSPFAICSEPENRENVRPVSGPIAAATTWQRNPEIRGPSKLPQLYEDTFDTIALIDLAGRSPVELGNGGT